MAEQEQKVAGVEAKVDILLEELRELRKTMNTNYVPRTEIDERLRAQGERITKLENALIKVNYIVWALVIGGIFTAIFGITK